MYVVKPSADGKTVVVECGDEADCPTLKDLEKITAGSFGNLTSHSRVRVSYFFDIHGSIRESGVSRGIKLCLEKG